MEKRSNKMEQPRKGHLPEVQVLGRSWETELERMSIRKQRSPTHTPIAQQKMMSRSLGLARRVREHSDSAGTFHVNCYRQTPIYHLFDFSCWCWHTEENQLITMIVRRRRPGERPGVQKDPHLWTLGIF